MKKSAWVFLFTTIIIFYLSACSRECTQDDSYTGIAMPIDLGGASPQSGVVNIDGQFVITTDSVYKLSFPAYSNFNPPDIDFSSYSLLGYENTSYCKVSYQRNVQSDNATSTYHYKLTIYECKTFNKKGCVEYNWVLVPKLPVGWRVTFEMINKIQ